MGTISLQSIESKVLTQLNAHESTSATSAETLYQKITAKSSATDIGDEAFFLSRVRDAILDAEHQVIRFICQTEGHPRRTQWRNTTSLALTNNAVALPTAFAYGRFSASNRELDERSPSEVDAMIRDTAYLNGVAIYYYAKSGNTLIATTSPVTLEYFDRAKPAAAAHPSTLSTLFDSNTDLMEAPDEFAEAIVFMACGALALTAGSFQEQANSYFRLATEIMAQEGVKAVPHDLSDQRPAQKRREQGQ